MSNKNIETLNRDERILSSVKTLTRKLLENANKEVEHAEKVSTQPMNLPYYNRALGAKLTATCILTFIEELENEYSAEEASRKEDKG